MPAQTVIKLRRDTAANWGTVDPILAAGEAGFESDTGKLKIGDGTTAWSGLGYVSGGASVEVGDAAPSSPEANMLWWESDTGTLFIYYDGYWVEAVAGVVGPVGPAGADGTDGAAATIAVGTVTTVASTDPATVTNSGTNSAAVFDFEIPAGATGATGATGPAGADGADGGFDSTQTIADLSSNHSVVSTDAGILYTNSAAVTVTVEGLSVGQQVDFLQTNAAQITFAAGSGITLYSKDAKLKTAAQYSPASIKCIATNTYVLIGDLGA